MLKLIWIPFLVGIFACEKVHNGQFIIDSVVEIEISEASSGNTDEVILRCKTQKEYLCYNYVISYDKGGDSNSFRISFQTVSLDASEHCASAIGPATAEINLGALAAGVYTLELNNRTLTNSGSLVVTDSELILDFPQQKGIDIINPVVLR